jgi:hypothetical protein
MSAQSMRVRRRRFSGLIEAFARGLDWRLLMLWTLLSLLPTTLVVVPVWRVLAAALDSSPRVPELAAQFDMLAFADLQVSFQRSSPALGGVTILATLVALAIWPLFTAMLLASANVEARLGFAALFRGALGWYGRALRLWLVSLVPLGLAVGCVRLLSKTAERYAERAIFESQASFGERAALIASLIVLWLVHVTVEAGRAELARNAALRSGWRAWLAGVRRTLQRPVSVPGLYLAATLPSLVVASVLLVLRLRMPAGGGVSFWISLLLTQLAVASIGWGKLSRLFALTALGVAESVAARGELSSSATPAQPAQAAETAG